MGKRSKTSRKGKKAWRANISSEDIEDFFEKTTRDALSGGNLSAAPSEDLFHVDKSHGLFLFLSLFFSCKVSIFRYISISRVRFDED